MTIDWCPGIREACAHWRDAPMLQQTFEAMERNLEQNNDACIDCAKTVVEVVCRVVVESFHTQQAPLPRPTARHLAAQADLRRASRSGYRSAAQGVRVVKYEPQKHRRQSMRLQNHDYTQPGAYFVTVCAQDRACLFGDVVDGEMRLNEAGQIVQAVWNDLPRHYPTMQNDAFVVMPNHVHGVIMIVGTGFVGAGLKPAPTHGLPEFVRAFKTFSSRRINELRQTPGVKIWQRNYYEHVVRDDASLDRIREYIINNPRQWALDRENPLNIREGAGVGSSTSAGFVGADFVGAGFVRAGLKPAPTGDVAPTHGFRKREP